MSILLWKIVVTYPQTEIRRDYLADRYNLILAIVQFVHDAFLFRHTLNGSQQFTPLVAVPLTQSINKHL
jgi:hypothetical protein